MSLTLDEARALHAEVHVLDLHADTAKLMDKLGYDLAARHERQMPTRVNVVGHVDLPRLRDGGVAGQFFSFWTTPYPQRGCTKSVTRQLDALDVAMAKHPTELRWTRTGADVRAAKAAGQIAALGGIEGGQALEDDLETIEAFSRRGVRYLGLLHFSANAIGRPAKGRGSDATVGLTAFGRDVIRECERTGVIVDLAHINRKGFFDALELATVPPMVSHTGVSGVHEHWRNIDDAQLRALADKGGCCGIIFARKFLGSASIDAVVDHLLHVIDIAGDDVPALGSDFDGFVVPPEGLEDVAAMPNLTVALSRRGVPPRVLEKILGGNVLRVLDAVPAWGRLAAS
ncbi:MAG: Membrane dipeptidase [Deltaproteobacteria bacterium]|nr:Membrane dipeptidase [Deltaproteobacteria bacterium]